MYKIFVAIRHIFLFALLAGLMTSCVNSKKIAYFNDVPDSTTVLSRPGIEPIIQNKDILSIIVSSLSGEATAVFNYPNLPLTPNATINTGPQTAGYLVSQDGVITFPMLGEIKVAGLTQKQLENIITKLLVEKKLLFQPIVAIRYLNFRVTVLGEVARPGVVAVPSEQISVLEAIGQAGDLTINGLRDNVIIIRQEGEAKVIKRLNLNSSEIFKSPYYYLRSNDVIYVEPGKAKIGTSDRTQQLLPIMLSGLSLLVIFLNSILK